MNKVVKIVFDDDTPNVLIKSFLIALEYHKNRNNIVAQIQVYEEDFEEGFEFEEEEEDAKD